MLLKLSLASIEGKNIILSRDNNDTLQGFIYSIIMDKEFAAFLHDIGYANNNRAFKLFSFSRILEKPIKFVQDKKFIVFPETISFMLCTVQNDLLKAIFQRMLASGEILNLGRNKIKLSGIGILPDPEFTAQKITAISPICCYNTVTMLNNKKRTIYYHPREKEFTAMVQRNLLKKYAAYYNKPLTDEQFVLQPLGKCSEQIVFYKGFIVKGYTGNFYISGSPELIKMAFEGGVGAKNSQGFGLIIPQQFLKEVE